MLGTTIAKRSSSIAFASTSVLLQLEIAPVVFGAVAAFVAIVVAVAVAATQVKGEKDQAVNTGPKDPKTKSEIGFDDA